MKGGLHSATSQSTRKELDGATTRLFDLAFGARSETF